MGWVCTNQPLHTRAAGGWTAARDAPNACLGLSTSGLQNKGALNFQCTLKCKLERWLSTLRMPGRGLAKLWKRCAFKVSSLRLYTVLNKGLLRFAEGALTLAIDSSKQRFLTCCGFRNPARSMPNSVPPRITGLTGTPDCLILAGSPHQRTCAIVWS